MQKRGFVAFMFAILFSINIVYGGDCDLSAWRVYDDTGAVTFGGATIGGYMFDFTSDTTGYGFRRLFTRIDFGEASTTNTTSDQIKQNADSFMASNSQKFGIFSYSNSRIYGTSSSGADIAYDTTIIVDPNTCEGLEYINGDAIFYYDLYGNLLGAEFRVVLTFLSGSSSSSLPPTNLSNPNYGGDGAIGGGGGVAGGAGDKQGVGESDSATQDNNPKLDDIQNPESKNTYNIFNPQKYYTYVVPIMPIFLFLAFSIVLFFLIGARKKKY